VRASVLVRNSLAPIGFVTRRTRDVDGARAVGLRSDGRGALRRTDPKCPPCRGARPDLRGRTLAGTWVAGNVPVRFPVSPPHDDRGWHVDANTPRPDGSWAVSGRPHTVLLLTLLSDVGPNDAPARIRAGSHVDVARTLGQDMLEAMAAGPVVDDASAGRPWSTQRGRLVTRTSCIRSPCTPPTSIGASRRGSWPSPRSCRPRRSNRRPRRRSRACSTS
jgi:hypothetical protein